MCSTLAEKRRLSSGLGTAGAEGKLHLQLWQNFTLALWRCMERIEMKPVLALEFADVAKLNEFSLLIVEIYERMKAYYVLICLYELYGSFLCRKAVKLRLRLPPRIHYTGVVICRRQHVRNRALLRRNSGAEMTQGTRPNKGCIRSSESTFTGEYSP